MTTIERLNKLATLYLASGHTENFELCKGAADELAALRKECEGLKADLNNRHSLRRCRELRFELERMTNERDVALGLANGDDIPDETVQRILCAGAVTERWRKNELFKQIDTLHSQNRVLALALHTVASIYRARFDSATDELVAKALAQTEGKK